MTTLRFGILATPIYGAETPPRVHLAEHEELVSVAESLSFDYMACGQHFLGEELRYYQPVPYLAHLWHHAPSMHVLTGIVLLSMVNPADIAEQVATLDAITDGKAIFGVGLGYSDREYRAVGMDPKLKVSRFEEGLELIRALWSGKAVTSHSRFWNIEDARPSVLPVQRPGPPVWVGGQAEPAVRRAALLGDAWYAPPFPTHGALADLRSAYLRIRDEAGLSADAPFPVRRELIVADTREQARRMGLERSELRYSTYKKWGLGGANTPVRDADGIDVDAQFLLGSPAEVVDQLGRLQEQLGMTHFSLRTHWQGLPHRDAMEQLERFGGEVIPQLRE